MLRRTLVGCVVLLALAVLLPGCKKRTSDGGGDASPQGPVYSTPQEVFDAYQKAQKAGDGKTIIGCLSSESQDLFVGMGVVQMARAIKAEGKSIDEKTKKIVSKVKDVFEKHGLAAALDKYKDFKRPKDLKEMKLVLLEAGGMVKD